MNNSNAAAKRRRAGIQPTVPPAPTQVGPSGFGSQQQSSTSQPGGFTLPQVIALIDTRLITLEKFMKDTKEAGDLSIPDYKRGDGEDSDGSSAVFMDSKEFTEFVDDVNQRFQLFADEINGLKEVVLKLQGFTMDVNRMLLAGLKTQGEPIPNITMECESGSEEPEPIKMELAEQTFVLESQSSVSEPVDGVDKAVTAALTGKKKR